MSQEVNNFLLLNPSRSLIGILESFTLRTFMIATHRKVSLKALFDS